MIHSSDEPGDGAVSRRRGVVAVIHRRERFLAIRRSRSVVAPGAYCFPGGGIESGETQRQALVRELREELNLEARPIRRLWTSVTPWDVQLAWWLADFSEDCSPVANPAEVESVHWFTADELLAQGELLESNRGFFAALAAGEFALDDAES